MHWLRKHYEKFANPYYDQSDPSNVWESEERICDKLVNTDLVQARRWVEEIKNCAVWWYWSSHPDYPSESDVAVSRLMSRGVIRSVTCAGGYTKMVFTDLALQLSKKR